MLDDGNLLCNNQLPRRLLATMIDLKRILVPLDFSGASLNTLKHGVTIASHFDAKQAS